MNFNDVNIIVGVFYFVLGLIYTTYMSNADIADTVSRQITRGLKPVQKPTVLVLMGLQYSGKSYLAEKIAEHNYGHFWATKIKKTYGIKNPEMVEIARHTIKRACSTGFNIVIDFVNYKHQIRAMFQEAAESVGCDYKVVFIDTSKVERLRRRELNIANGETSGRRIISLQQMEEFEAEFERPKETEPTIKVTSNTEMDEFIHSLDQPSYDSQL